MAVPIASVAGSPVLASAGITALVALLIGVAGFALVVAVTAVVLALLQAILPGGDSGAEAVHRAELERAAAARAGEADFEAEQAAPDLRSGAPLL